MDEDIIEEINFGDFEDSDDEIVENTQYVFFKTYNFFVLFSQYFNIGVAHELWGKIDGSKQWINYADEHFLNRNIILYYESLNNKQKDDIINWYNDMLITIDLGVIPELRLKEIEKFTLDDIKQFKKESQFIVKVHQLLKKDDKYIKGIMKKVWGVNGELYFYKFKYNAADDIILFYGFLTKDEKFQFIDKLSNGKFV